MAGGDLPQSAERVDADPRLREDQRTPRSIAQAEKAVTFRLRGHHPKESRTGTQPTGSQWRQHRKHPQHSPKTPSPHDDGSRRSHVFQRTSLQTGCSINNRPLDVATRPPTDQTKKNKSLGVCFRARSDGRRSSTSGLVVLASSIRYSRRTPSRRPCSWCSYKRPMITVIDGVSLTVYWVSIPVCTGGTMHPVE